jgi:acetyl esterase/lipase
LLRAIAELVNAANGLRPLVRNSYLTLPVFAFGWPTTELPLWLLSVSAFDTLLRAHRGVFAGPSGRTALLLTAIAWEMLWVVHRRGGRAARYLDDALREALGPDYRVVAGTAATRMARPKGVLRTGWARRTYVEKAGTVRYGPHDRTNTLDIWRRRDLPRDGHAPVLVHVPGGAWVLGRRRGQAYPLLGYLAACGWVCVSIDYRVSPMHTWPDHMVDVKRALAWVKQNIATAGGDPDFVAITGGSAGGHLAALAALTPNDSRFQPGFADADTSVVAAVSVYGRYDWFSTEGPGRAELIAFLERFVVKRKQADDWQVFFDASPVKRPSPNAPPFFVLHGSNDSIIPVLEARDFIMALRAASKSPVAYAELPGAQHAFDIFGSPRARHTASAIGQFLSWVYATSRRANSDASQSVVASGDVHLF